MAINVNDLTGTLARILSSIDGFVDAFTDNIRDMRSRGVSQAAIKQRVIEDILTGNGGLNIMLSALDEKTKSFQQNFFLGSQRDILLRGKDPGVALFTWIAVGSGTCPGCIGRHGNTHTWNDWQKFGLPGTGQTVCRYNCRCALVPAQNARDLYGVETNEEMLTTAREPIRKRALEVNKLAKIRGKKFAEATFMSKLGDFKGFSETITIGGLPSKGAPPRVRKLVPSLREFRKSGRIKELEKLPIEKLSNHEHSVLVLHQRVTAKQREIRQARNFKKRNA